MENLKSGRENCIYEMSVLFLLPTEEELYRFKSFYFFDYDAAFGYVLSHTKEIGVLRSFDIKRLRVFTGDESSKTRNWVEHVYFNSSGELLRIYGGKEQAFDKLCACCAAVNPFNDLDIVMHFREGEIGVVESPEAAQRGKISVLFEWGSILEVNPMCLEKIDGNSEPILRERAVKVIREQLNLFGEEKRATLEKTISELSAL